VAIIFPVKGLKVTQIISSTFGDRLNMVYFPSVISGSSIITSLDSCPAHVLFEYRVPGIFFGLSPYVNDIIEIHNYRGKKEHIYRGQNCTFMALLHL
jgi:hypothetical protein